MEVMELPNTFDLLPIDNREARSHLRPALLVTLSAYLIRTPVCGRVSHSFSPELHASPY